MRVLSLSLQAFRFVADSAEQVERVEPFAASIREQRENEFSV
jgi:hypothetical protein